MARESHRIAPTAHFTAQAWVRGGFPNAEYFDTLEGRLLFGALQRTARRLDRVAPSLGWHEEFLYVRHQAYETRLEQMAPGFVLEVGAGLSPRGITLTRQRPELVYVEIDLPGMVAAKRERLSGVGLPRHYHLQPGDILSPDFAESLVVEPKNGERILVVTEGLTDYLDMGQKRRAWSNLARFLRRHGGGRYLFEVYTKKRLAKYRLSASAALGALSLLLGARMDKRLFYDAAEAVEAVRDSGFEDARLLDLEALNTSPYRPPMDYCYFDLVEARI